jgi:WD40 repeat protein
MGTLQLLPVNPGTENHGGEVYGCAYSPDGAFVLSAGWDGHLRLWETASGNHVSALCAGSKPLSACQISADGKQWLAGSLDGMLTFWDPMSRRPLSTFLAHTRPLSAIQLLPDGRLLTASWDRSVVVWKLGRERESRSLIGHEDIVAGCRCAADGRTLLSWSHDCTLRTWDLEYTQLRLTFTGHRDRVTAGAISPDGRWAASGSRDGVLKLWDFQTGEEISTTAVEGEVRGCFFLLDGESIVVVDQHGRVTWRTAPTLEERAQLISRLPVQCSELAPAGNQLVLGCDDGRPRFVTIAGMDDNPLVVTPTQSKRRTRTMMDRLFGRSRLTDAYSCTCPACGCSFDLEKAGTGQDACCPHCRRRLRLGALLRVAVD